MKYDPQTQKVLVELGQEIRRLRKTKKWTQEELAEHAGIYDKEVSQIELGNRNISIQILLRLAKALEVAPDTLLKKAFSAANA